MYMYVIFDKILYKKMVHNMTDKGLELHSISKHMCIPIYCIAGNNGSNYTWRFAPCSPFDINLANLLIFFTILK